MASNKRYTLEEAVNKFVNSDVDSCTGGMTSDEEEELDLAVLNDGLISYSRFVFII